MNYILSFVLIFCFSFTGTLDARNKDFQLTGIWKEVFLDNEDTHEIPLTLVFTKNSDSVLLIEGNFGYMEKFYKYTVKRDSLFIHGMFWGNEGYRDFVGKIHKSYLEFPGFNFEKLKVPKLRKEFDKVSIVPNIEDYTSYLLRFSKFTLSYNGKYFFTPTPQFDLIKSSGEFNKIISPHIFAALENIKDEADQTNPIGITVLFYKKGKLIKEVKNNDSEMQWVFQFINLYTYRTY